MSSSHPGLAKPLAACRRHPWHATASPPCGGRGFWERARLPR